MGLCLGSLSRHRHRTEPTTSNKPPDSGTAINDCKDVGSAITSSSSSTGKSQFSEIGSGSLDGSQYSLSGQILGSPNLKVFTFEDLKTATKSFNPVMLLGEGGFGKVFKGWLDEKTLTPAKTGSGMAVAIKKLNRGSEQGFRKWQQEIHFSGRLSHSNLVKLWGYCWEDEELLLVYEFMLKGNLDNHLFRRHPNIESLSWKMRLKITMGAARGLTFLHSLERQIIHGDFKASNILLDRNYNAKISNFSWAKLWHAEGESHVITRIMGTDGYAAPEYFATSHSYVKSDVYGFGVVLLEILTGKRAFDTKRPNRQQNSVE